MTRVSKGTRTNRSTKPQELPTRFQAGFIRALDQRTELAKGLTQRFWAITEDLGGIGELSQIKASLVERYVWLEASLSQMETALATTEDAKAYSEMLSRWIQGCNSLLGIAKTLGIDRKLANAPWLEGVAK